VKTAHDLSLGSGLGRLISPSGTAEQAVVFVQIFSAPLGLSKTIAPQPSPKSLGLEKLGYEVLA
jgi:hypothetical protein